MIDTSIVRVHQHGACITRNQRQSMGRSRGGLTSKIHAVVDSNGLPVRLNIASFYWWSSNGKPAVFGGLVFLWLSYACVPGAKFSQLTSDNRWQATRR
jgi:hypothetical protein